ncbi:MAG TPA: hypothetical protein VEZ12_21530 [Herpetosiphonaceae bacterium]|nr:hypothetical protein [Herpetosiphonaceae bacterium]
MPEDLIHDGPAIIVVTGIMAAGKTTISRLLAQRFARGVHVEADKLQEMIVSGGEWVTEIGEPSAEATRQLRLRLRNMCLLGFSFYEAGFTVILDDIILGDRWEHLQEDLRDVPFSLVVLAPSARVVAEDRDRRRAKSPLGEAWTTYLDQNLRATMCDVGFWLDTSEQTPHETVARILQHLLPKQE